MAHAPADPHAAENAKLFSGSPYKAILRLAMPTVIAMLSQSAVNEIDVLFFSRLPCPESSNGQAALLPSLLIVWLFGGSLSAISVGTQALTARRYAQRKYEGAGAVLANSAWFCLLAGVVLSVVGVVSLKWILNTMVQVDEVRDIAFSYSRWRLMGVISMAMTMAIKAFFDGVGKTYVHLGCRGGDEHRQRHSLLRVRVRRIRCAAHGAIRRGFCGLFCRRGSVSSS